MLSIWKSIINIQNDVLTCTEAHLSSLHNRTNYLNHLTRCGLRGWLVLRNCSTLLEGPHLVSSLLRFVEGPPEFLWGVVFVLLVAQVPVALFSMVGLWCSLWLSRVAMKQQVACTWGSNVPFCMSCLSYHLAWLYWLLLLGLPLLFRVSCWHSLTLPGIPAHWKLWFLPPDPSPPAVHNPGSQECRPSARNFFF